MKRWTKGWTKRRMAARVSVVRRAALAAVVSAGLGGAWGGAALAQQSGAAGVLPSSSIVYLEITRPMELVDLGMDHPIAKRVMAMPFVRAAYESNDGLAGIAMVTEVLENELGRPWREIVADVTAGGVYLSFDLSSGGPMLLVKGGDGESGRELLEAFVDLARRHAEASLEPSPVESARYKGFTGYQMGDAAFASVGEYVVVGAKGEQIKKFIDGYVDGVGTPLSEDAAFVEARAKRGEGANGWGFVRLGTLRALGVAPEVLKGGSNNPGAELLVGGVLAALRDADYATAELYAGAESLRLAMTVPTKQGLWRSTRGFFFGPDGRGTTEPLRVDGTVVSVSAYRDFADLWNAAPDLFPENVATQMAQIDSQLGNFFGGVGFGADLLPAIGADVQLIAVRESFEEGGERPVPTIRIPAGAIVLRVGDARVRKMLTAGFQTLLSFANIQGAMDGRPPLIQENVEYKGAKLVTTDYLAMGNGERGGEIYWNFSPTFAVFGDRVALCATRGLAEKLVDAAERTGEGLRISENTLIELDGKVALAMLEENREQIVAQTMLSQGVSPDEAEGRVKLVLEMLRYLGGADMKLITGSDEMRLEIGVDVDVDGGR